jgi:hypothetical protein
MKIYGVSGDIAPPFLTSALYGGECSASRLSRFTPGTHLIGGWIGITFIQYVTKEKNTCYNSWAFVVINQMPRGKSRDKTSNKPI